MSGHLIASEVAANGSSPMSANDVQARREQISEQLIRWLGSASLQRSPWSYVHLNGPLEIDLARELAGLFDNQHMRRFERQEGSKSYRLSTASIGHESQITGPGAIAAQVLQGGEYRDAIGTLTSVDLTGREVTLDLWEYGGGDWLAPHLDKAEKLVTQIIYLTEEWPEAAGGRLLILQRDDVASMTDAVVPHFGHSAILVRSESSWHAVEEVVSGAPRRRSLTITYWSEKP